MSGSRRKSKDSKVMDDMPEGLTNALEKVKELNEAEMEEHVEVENPQLPELRNLLFFGKIREQVNIGGYIFELTTLTNKQQRSLISRLVKMDDEGKLLSIKPMTLAESLISVNGLPLEDLYDGDQELSDIDLKLEVISDMQYTLVERLFEEYEKINKKSTDLARAEDLEDQIKK